MVVAVALGVMDTAIDGEYAHWSVGGSVTTMKTIGVGRLSGGAIVAHSVAV